MSYDVALHVRVYGAEDVYAQVAEPEYSEPTYNLREMFVACMDWEYFQSEKGPDGKWHTIYYPCSEVIDYVNKGLHQLTIYPEKYKKYNPPNGWGDLNTAIEFLRSLQNCIYETAQRIPIKYLYMSW